MADRGARKLPVNLSVDGGLLADARRLGINLSETLEAELRARVKAHREKRWVEENKEALAVYNLRVSEHGLLSDKAGLL